MHFTPHQWETAYTWLCQQRRHHPAQSDIWDVRFHWQQEKTQIQQRLKNGAYYFAPLQCIQKQNGEVIHLWSSRDALVLKLITLTLSDQLPIAPSCTHVKNHGGLKHTVCQVANNLPEFNFVIRTDVKAYYASIDHHLLINKLALYIKDKALLNLLWHYMNRLVERGGLYKEIKKGIARGCPLSPLIGAFFLTELDKSFELNTLLKLDNHSSSK